ncbi:MAG: HAD family hydrolase [Candidatus Edwardsbacteria bacterium]
MKRAVFLDRDGTINVDYGYIGEPDKVKLLPSVAKGIRLLNEKGFLVIVITNQSGVARGYFDEKTVKRVNQGIAELLAQENARIDAFYFCPHHPDFGNKKYRKDCSCRKPKPGLFKKAALDFKINFAKSWIVGNEPRDIEMGKELGAKMILLGKHNLLQVAKRIVRDSLIADMLIC